MEIYDVVLIPLIIGIVSLLKMYGMPRKLLPVMALIFGVVGGIIYIYPEDIKAGILVGLMMGLSASGLYSGGRTVIEKTE
ncbi:hypothetical protein I2483_00390 [Sporosarcina sp. E16_3]|uniref:hypothetical protein n=1 Tax=Sporosarcina sp. E16_3 TaxID=2789293 RepID=UPI001A9280FD|nr:hypothetical protein [Sporosarcina sp. E16_3]MBO0600109.1 hypothetical protein [Sporosarcina sp. E16_3]